MQPRGLMIIGGAILGVWALSGFYIVQPNEQAVVTTFGAYADLSEYGLMFPTIWKETVAGKPRIDIKVVEGRVASYAVFPKPAALAAARDIRKWLTTANDIQ